MKAISTVLSELPEWEDDWKAHALFCAYDSDTSEEFVVSFWKRALTKVFDEHIPSLSISLEELKPLFQRKGRFPLGLPEIIAELVKRGDLVSIEDLQEQVDYRIASKTWGGWIGKKISKLWSKKNFEVHNVASLAKLKKKSENVIKWCRDMNRCTFVIEEIEKSLNMESKDVRILVNYMILQGSALNYQEFRGNIKSEIVKIKVNIDENLEVKPEDSAIVSLNLTLAEIDKKIEEMTKNKDFLYKQVVSELKSQNRTNAKHFMLRKKMVEQGITNLMGSRLNIEEKLLALSNSVTNLNILKTMSVSNNAFKNLMPDLKDVSEIIDSSKDLIDSQREISSLMSENIDINDDDELLKEFEELDTVDLPSVPKYKINERPILNEKVFVDEEYKKNEIVFSG